MIHIFQSCQDPEKITGWHWGFSQIPLICCLTHLTLIHWLIDYHDTTTPGCDQIVSFAPPPALGLWQCLILHQFLPLPSVPIMHSFCTWLLWDKLFLNNTLWQPKNNGLHCQSSSMRSFKFNRTLLTLWIQGSTEINIAIHSWTNNFHFLHGQGQGSESISLGYWKWFGDAQGAIYDQFNELAGQSTG